jgi:hypothetical protein
MSAHLLGRHITQSSEHDARLRARGRGRQARLDGGAVLAVGQLREPEIENLDAAVQRHEDVVGLQVPMDDALLVRGGQPLRDLERVIHGSSHGQRAAGEASAQRLPLERLRDDVEEPVLPSDVEYRRDVGVVQRSRSLRLLFEATQPIGILGERGRQDLDRDLALEPFVPGAVNLAHPARPDGGQDLVRSELRSGREPHSANRRRRL